MSFDRLSKLAGWWYSPSCPLAPPSLVRLALAVLRRQFKVRTVADLAALDLNVAKGIKGGGGQQLDALAQLKVRAQKICQREGVTVDPQQSLPLDARTAGEEAAAGDHGSHHRGVVLNSGHLLVPDSGLCRA